MLGIETESERAEVGYALGQEFWGRGYMREALVALVNFSFTKLGFRRLDAQVDSRNKASCNLLNNIGFVGEGRLRERKLAKGSLVDLNLYGLLKSEWRGSANS